MPKSENQKLKLLYIVKILEEKTDSEHGITLSQLLKELEAYGISAERKSLYSDIESLKQFGYDIVGEKGYRNYYYKLVSRDFELAELKLLVDSVQSSKFITAKKSRELIKKLESLASRYEASKLSRQVVVTDRVKAANESILYNVDLIYTAINENSAIRFQYFQWNVKKKMELRHDGKFYSVSPWLLTWDDENYYMIAYDEEAGQMKHYRVDKMLHIGIENRDRVGRELYEKLDMACYTKQRFGMFGGELVNVRIKFKNTLAGVVIDRFGTDPIFVREDEEHFVINVDVAVSDQFLGWIMSLGDGAVIEGPTEVVDRMKQMISGLERIYSLHDSSKTDN